MDQSKRINAYASGVGLYIHGSGRLLGTGTRYAPPAQPTWATDILIFRWPDSYLVSIHGISRRRAPSEALEEAIWAYNQHRPKRRFTSEAFTDCSKADVSAWTAKGRFGGQCVRKSVYGACEIRRCVFAPTQHDRAAAVFLFSALDRRTGCGVLRHSEIGSLKPRKEFPSIFPQFQSKDSGKPRSCL